MTWIFYVWETDTFSTPQEAVERYEMGPGDVLALEEVEARPIRTRFWKVQEDGTLLEENQHGTS